MMIPRNNSILIIALVALSSTTVSAFTIVDPTTTTTTTSARTQQVGLSSSSTTVDTDAVALSPKETVLSTARQCQDEFGLFLVDKTAKLELVEAVEALEGTYDTASAAPPTPGTWDLVCTTSTSTKGVDTKQFLPQPLKQLTDSLATKANRYVTVQQILKSTDSNNNKNNEVDRIDHVIAYAPPQSLTELLENLPEPLVNLKVNPLDVSKSQLILVHKASGVEDTTNSDAAITTTSLTLQSVIWNVAGNSTYLDPAGKDITSIQLPKVATDFLASGTFTTTYCDNDLRILRGKQGPLEFLRVFVPSPRTPDVMDVEDIPDAEIVMDDILAADAATSSGDDDVPSDVGQP